MNALFHWRVEVTISISSQSHITDIAMIPLHVMAFVRPKQKQLIPSTKDKYAERDNEYITVKSLL